jgi:hypothetical protein
MRRRLTPIQHAQAQSKKLDQANPSTRTNERKRAIELCQREEVRNHPTCTRRNSVRSAQAALSLIATPSCPSCMAVNLSVEGKRIPPGEPSRAKRVARDHRSGGKLASGSDEHLVGPCGCGFTRQRGFLASPVVVVLHSSKGQTLGFGRRRGCPPRSAWLT